VRFSGEERVRVVIRGGAEAYLVAEELASRGIGVIVDPFVYGPGSFDQVLARRDNPARLRKAGLTVAISPFSPPTPRQPRHPPPNVRRLRRLAGNAGREGRPWESGLDAIPAAPAKLFGMDGYGVLAPGAVANVAVWSGDPLEISTSLEQLFIVGEPVTLRSRQT